MRKLLKSFVTDRHANRHLLFIDAHSMLILFVTATMIQFLFSWKQIQIVILTIRGAFLVLSFLTYVLSRTLKKQEHHDLLVLVAFTAFVFYRIFAENLATVIPGKLAVLVEGVKATSFVDSLFLSVASCPSFSELIMSCSYFFFDYTSGASHMPDRTYWALISLYLCTGIPLKLLLGITFTAFVGLVIQVIAAGKWEGWVVDLPLFLVYASVGMILYYTFFCIGIEICRLKHRPLRSIKDLPSTFYKGLESQALNSLPLTVLKKVLKREEHLFVLFRITQVEEFRDVALQLIGEDSEFEATLGDNAKLDRAFLRANLIHFHFKDCPNPTIRKVGVLITETEYDKGGADAVLQNRSSETFTTTRAREFLQRRPSHTLSHRHSRKTGYAELSLFSSFGKHGTGLEGGRQQLVSLASKITLSRQQSDGRSLQKKAQSNSTGALLTGRRHNSGESVVRRHTPTSYSHHTPHSNGPSRGSYSNFPRSNSSLETNDVGAHSKSSLARTVTVGTVTFPVLDVDRAVSQARAERNGQQRQQCSMSSSHTTLSSGKTKQGHSRLCGCRSQQHNDVNAYRRKSWVGGGRARQPRVSVNEVLEVRLQTYDDILQRPINPMWDPISVQIDSRIKILQLAYVQRYAPCLKRLARWLQGVEAVMTSAQWRQRIHVPKRGVFGRFIDIKIERWFLAWLAPVQV